MRLITDNRGHFVNLSIKVLFDQCLPIFFSSSVRQIQGDNSSHICMYILAFFEYIETHNLLKIELQLQHACYFDPKEDEKLDELITAGMLATRRKCCNFIDFHRLKKHVK